MDHDAYWPTGVDWETGGALMSGKRACALVGSATKGLLDTWVSGPYPRLEYMIDISLSWRCAAESDTALGICWELECYDWRQCIRSHMLYSSVDEEQCKRTVKPGVHGGQV